MLSRLAEPPEQHLRTLKAEPGDGSVGHLDCCSGTCTTYDSFVVVASDTFVTLFHM